MKVKLEHMPAVLAQFMDTHVVPKYDGWHKAAAVAVGIGLNQKAQNIVKHEGLVQQLSAFGLCDKSGLIDLDAAKAFAHEVLEKSGGEIDDMGYVFDKADIDSIYKIAATVAEQG